MNGYVTQNQAVGRILKACVAFWVLLAIGFPIAISHANESKEDALKRGADPVWYSEEKGAIIPARPASREQINANDRFDKLASTTDTTRTNYSWLSELFEGLFTFIRNSWQVVLILVLVAGITLVILILLKIQRFVEPPTRASQTAATLAAQQYKVTDLPFELASPDIPLLQLVQEYRNRGDYSKAIVYLYSLMLIELDAAGWIRLAKGKTNWTYLSELSDRQEERNFATTVVYWFEHVFFGKHKMESDAFEAIWISLPHFQERLQSARRERA